MQTAPDTHSLTVGYLLWLFGFTGSHPTDRTVRHR